MGEEDDMRQAKAIRDTIAASKHPQSTLKTYVGPGYGTLLFPLWADLAPAIANWLKAQLLPSTQTR